MAWQDAGSCPCLGLSPPRCTIGVPMLSLQLLTGRWDISQLRTKWECSIKTQGGACGNAALGAAPSQPCPSQKEGGTKYSPSVPWEQHRHRQPAFPSPVPQLSAFLENHPPGPSPRLDFAQLCSFANKSGNANSAAARAALVSLQFIFLAAAAGGAASPRDLKPGGREKDPKSQFPPEPKGCSAVGEAQLLSPTLPRLLLCPMLRSCSPAARRRAGRSRPTAATWL